MSAKGCEECKVYLSSQCGQKCRKAFRRMDPRLRDEITSEL